MDGSGYPQGLKGDQILLGARILAVADVVEAISSHRPYRPGLGMKASLSEIKSKRGKTFDPRVVDACLRLIQDRNYVLPDKA
jgi:HD-GYP domain-containing protein (c-di-GMP phosphodiesterase class II)